MCALQKPGSDMRVPDENGEHFLYSAALIFLFAASPFGRNSLCKERGTTAVLATPFLTPPAGIFSSS
jgi:hypothetical protein